MHRVICVLGIAALLFLELPSALAANETVSGQLIDMACYIVNKANTGNAHKGKGYDCAQACAREGFPVGVLTADGKVYQVTGDLSANNNARLVPYMGKTVTITGEATEHDGQLSIRSGEIKAVTR